MNYAFAVYGVPIPKGSTKAFWRPGMKHAVVTHDNAKTRPWGEAVTAAALEKRGERAPIEEPVSLVARFYLPRPKTAPRRVVVPAKKPDLDKLVRSLKDGLTRAGIYRDDAQVVELVATKHFAAGAEDPDGERGIPRAVVEVRIARAQERPRATASGELFAAGDRLPRRGPEDAFAEAQRG